MMTTRVIGLLTFFLGLLLGNWLAIGRDKRKEFNEATTPIRGWLLHAKNEPNPFSSWPSSQELDRFGSHLWWWQRRAFNRHFKSYVEAHHEAIVQDPVYGSCSYGDTTKIKKQLEAMFAFTKWR